MGIDSGLTIGRSGIFVALGLEGFDTEQANGGLDAGLGGDDEGIAVDGVDKGDDIAILEANFRGLDLGSAHFRAHAEVEGSGEEGDDKAPKGNHAAVHGATLAGIFWGWQENLFRLCEARFSMLWEGYGQVKHGLDESWRRVAEEKRCVADPPKVRRLGKKVRRRSFGGPSPMEKGAPPIF